MAFQQALSGLSAASKNLEVIGNNVANANTVGFKQSQAQFADVYAASLSGGGGTQIGIGTKLAAVAQQFTQGNVSVTSNTLDMAINGPGFFRMDNNGALTYSRNGQFQLDRTGFIVNSQGNKLTGYTADANGIIVPGALVTMQIPTADLAAKASTTGQVGLNLDARSTAPTTATFSPSDPTSFNNSTSTTIYDSLGNSHIAILYFVKALAASASSSTFTTTSGSATVTTGSTTGLVVGQTVTGTGFPAGTRITSITNSTTFVANQNATATGTPSLAFGVVPANTWDTYMTVDTLAPSGAAVTSINTLLGALTFSSAGVLTAPTVPQLGVLNMPAGSIVYANGATTPQALALNFSTSTQFGTGFGVNTLSQDGYTAGRLSGFSTSSNGTILGRYTNGQSKALGQVVLANFSNVQGLQPLGGNAWGEAASSGAPLVGAPGSGRLGVLQSAAVEDSNVDLTGELVMMITAQRIYQANAQTIKAADAMMQTLVNLR